MLEAFVITRKGRTIFKKVLSPNGVLTADVYRELNSIVQPKKVLLFAGFDKPNEIFHKPRLTGGVFDLKLVSDYPRGADPESMIKEKATFKESKRKSREHNASVLAEMVGRILYVLEHEDDLEYSAERAEMLGRFIFKQDPKTFHKFATEVLEHTEGPRGFIGAEPTTSEQFRQIYRYYDSAGPRYRAAPQKFLLTEQEANDLEFLL